MLIRDHDVETSVLEAVSKLNEVKTMKGLTRYFKEVAQSTRTNRCQDDFLGCVNVSVKDIPPTGVKSWFILAGNPHQIDK